VGRVAVERQELVLAVARGDVVVGVPVYGAPEKFAPCLLSLLRHTPPEVAIVVWDDASPGHDIEAIVEQALEGSGRDRLVYVRADENQGIVASFNALVRLAAPADVVLVNSDVTVAAGWLDGLRAAALSDDRVATATPLTNHGTIVSVPTRNVPTRQIAGGLSVDDAAERVGRLSLRLRPELPTAIGHCFYIRRQALELVGDFDLIFSPGYFEEVDFSQRCIAAGLQHVCADDVFVYHAGSSSFGSGTASSTRYARSSAVIDARYPHFRRMAQAAADDQYSQLARAIDRADVALRRDDVTVSVTIDARCLDRIVTGTQVHVLELIRALHDAERALIRVVIPDVVDRSVRDALVALPALEVVTATGLGAAPVKTDIVHRPFQATDSLRDLEFSHALGRRFVITQQDFIGYDNPAYFDDPADFERYRELSQLAMAVADRVVCSTRYVGDDAVRRGFVDAERLAIANLGAGHLLAEPKGPAGRLDRRVRQPYLVLAGTDYQHKNRRFAIDVVRVLRREHGWDGSLVLCGARIPRGTSGRLEAEAFLVVDDASDFLVDLGEVADADMRGLLAHASGVIYPTVSEGFGFVPFEAAGVGVPCFFAPLTALGELLPHEAALIEPWDAEITAERIARVLDDDDTRAEHVQVLRDAAARYTWSATAETLLATYEEILREPINPARSSRISGENAGALAYELHRVYTSRSWRYMRPFRWLRRVMLGPAA
jgi:GT2 family glycosyltransferase/glycosyltransferase involved in cell wall biosynthesis